MATQVGFSWLPPRMKGKHEENMQGKVCRSCMKSEVRNIPSLLVIPLSLISVKALEMIPVLVW